MVTATPNVLSFTTIISVVLLLKLITNSRKFMVRKSYFAKRSKDDLRNSTAATTGWSTWHDQEPQSFTTGRRYPEPFKQILTKVCESGRQRAVLQGKPLVVVPLDENSKGPKRPRVILCDLTPAQLKNQVDTCTLLLDRAVNTQWTRFIVIQDEKWISYNNPDHSLEWCDVDQDPEPLRSGLTHGKKEMSCFFFCSEGPVYW